MGTDTERKSWRESIFRLFIDGYNRHTWNYLIKKKCEVFDCFRNLKKSCWKGNRKEDEVLVGRMAEKSIFSANYLQQMGIQCEFSCRYMLEQNVLAERKKRSVVEVAWEIKEEKSMPKFYWAEAIWTVVYIQNRIGEKVSAHELYFGRKPNLRHVRVFGSIAYVHVPDEKWRKVVCIGRLVIWTKGL